LSGGKPVLRFLCILLCAVIHLSLLPPTQAQPAGGDWKASGKHGAVAAGGQGAVDAGIATLKKGGNATLRLLEGYDLKAMGHNQPDTIHTMVEALKLGLADRDFYFADPLFAQVPLADLLSPNYAALRRPLIDPKKASLVQRPGDPCAGKALHDKPDPRSVRAAQTTTRPLASWPTPRAIW
jgi:gamma-glutamyltranspeptidase